MSQHAVTPAVTYGGQCRTVFDIFWPTRIPFCGPLFGRTCWTRLNPPLQWAVVEQIHSESKVYTAYPHKFHIKSKTRCTTDPSTGDGGVWALYHAQWTADSNVRVVIRMLVYFFCSVCYAGSCRAANKMRRELPQISHLLPLSGA